MNPVSRSLAAAAALLALAACKVERTPPEFYQHRDPSVVERQEAAGEIHLRLTAFLQALNRGDAGNAVEALQPRPDVVVIGIRPDQGVSLRGPEGLAAALGEIEPPGLVRFPHPEVRVSLREGMAWFSAHLEFFTAGEPAPRVRMSGVFVRERAAWGLAQLHLSRALSDSAAPTAPGAPPPAAGSAPAAGG